MNLLRLGPKLDEHEWEVLWYAASYHYAEPSPYRNSPLVSRTPSGKWHNVPKTELLMLDVDVILQALRKRMGNYPTYEENSVLKKLLALKELEKRP